MEHLEFIEKLNKLGCSLSSTIVEDRMKIVKISNIFGEPDIIEIKNLKCNYANDSIVSRPAPLLALIKKAIDIDEWKHSWYIGIIPENYEKLEEIIQEKILDRAKEIDFLMTVYFLIESYN